MRRDIILLDKSLQETIIASYYDDVTIQTLWDRLMRMADERLGTNNWKISHDKSLFGGYIVQVEPFGDCLYIK